jgi:hypothetical protein
MSNAQIKFTADFLGTKLAVGLILAGIFLPTLGYSVWSLLLVIPGIAAYLFAHWMLGKLEADK